MKFIVDVYAPMVILINRYGSFADGAINWHFLRERLRKLYPELKEVFIGQSNEGGWFSPDFLAIACSSDRCPVNLEHVHNLRPARELTERDIWSTKFEHLFTQNVTNSWTFDVNAEFWHKMPCHNRSTEFLISQLTKIIDEGKIKDGNPDTDRRLLELLATVREQQEKHKLEK